MYALLSTTSDNEIIKMLKTFSTLIVMRKCGRSTALDHSEVSNDNNEEATCFAEITREESDLSKYFRVRSASDSLISQQLSKGGANGDVKPV
jgi:hypothetical protein